MKYLITLLTIFVFTNANSQDSSVIVKTSIVDDVKYKVTGNYTKTTLTIKRDKGKVIQYYDLQDIGSGFENIEFVDFNHDGYKDILISYMTNVADICDLFLYDKQRRQFIRVYNFSNYPSSISIGKTGLYYSYHRSGCADSDWDSNLFKIVNYKTVPLGTISGRDCGEGEENGVFVYFGKEGKQKLIKKYNIHVIDNFKTSKWGFIK